MTISVRGGFKTAWRTWNVLHIVYWHYFFYQINEPISEDEIKALFSSSSFDKAPDRLTLPKIKTSRPGSPVVRGSSGFDDRSNLAAQILLLYYVLLYENVRMSHMKSIVTGHRRVLKYSQVRNQSNNLTNKWIKNIEDLMFQYQNARSLL